MVDSIITQLNWRFENLKNINDDFAFLSGPCLVEMTVDQLKKCAADLAIKYVIDLNSVELTSEIESFKFHAVNLIKNITSFEILSHVYSLNLNNLFPNICVALRIFCTLPATVASAERSFSKLKIIKNYLRSAMSQERLSGMAILSIEKKIAARIDIEELIDSFSAVKARRVCI